MATEFDCIAGSQIRDTQGEMLDIEGADITELQLRGRANDNHGKGFFNSIGRITEAKKIFKEDDCDNERHKYYWDKIKAPYIYCKGELYDDEEHQNAKAAAAILRNVHKSDSPLKIKASVEGGVVSRGIKDSSLLARTKIHSVALTFTPANSATLVEPLNLDKSEKHEDDERLIKSVMHLAQDRVPSFRHIVRDSLASKVRDNLIKIEQIGKQLRGDDFTLNIPNSRDIIESALESKISNNVQKINNKIKELRKNNIKKALLAGYGGASAPTSRTHGAVMQTESLEGITRDMRGFKYITCDKCGKEQIHSKHQVKCRECGSGFSFDNLYRSVHGK